MTGRPITLEEWVDMFEESIRSNSKRVGLITRNNVTVSTVWLGINHNFSEEGPPLIFETMIFGGEHDNYQERYSTFEEAKAGHEEAVKLAFPSKKK